jgi:hypothetical protein
VLAPGIAGHSFTAAAGHAGARVTGEGIPHGVEWRTDELVRVGQLTVRIVSDTEGFVALSYFSRRARNRVTPPGAELPYRVDAEIWCISRGDPPADGLPAGGADTARFRGFRAGYYVTDHFGEPVHAIARGQNRVLLYGRRLERLIWPYFVKYLLLRTVR